MKNIYKIFAVLSIALIASSALYAQQNLRTAYFTDGYTYNYKLNPAFAPERSFFAFPVIGNLGVGVETNLGLSTYLYPTADGKMTTFLNSSVSDEQFLGKLNQSNKLNISLNETLLATGFRIGKSFHTIDLSVKMDVASMCPRDLFAFVKSGGSAGQDTWDISNIGLRANGRMEFAYGYQRSFSDNLRIGARVKVLMGLSQAEVLVDNLNLTMNSQKWSVKANGHANISGPYQGILNESADDVDMMAALNEALTAPSIGAALDLGASYDFLDYFTASLSVLDLGFISWNNTTTNVMPGGEWSFEGFDNLGTDGSIDDQLGNIGEDFQELLKMETTGTDLKKTSMLAATVHAGIEARMPFYERLTFGLLGTQRIDGPFSWTEGRVSANLAPVNWFSLSASYAISDFGNSFGGVVNIHIPGFNLYAGLDSFLPLMEMTPQYVPVNSLNTNLTFGLTFTFGKAVGRYRKSE